MKNTEMTKRALGAATLGLVLSASAAYAQNSTPNNAAATKSSSTDLSSTSGSAAADKKMLQDLPQEIKAEIAIARLAKDKSNDNQVKSYAQTLIDDHTDAGKKLQDLAQKKKVLLPDQRDSKQQAEKRSSNHCQGTSSAGSSPRMRASRIIDRRMTFC